MSLFDSVLSYFGGQKQANTVKDARADAINEMRQARDTARTDLSPWRTTGQNALLDVGNLAGVNGPDAAQQAMGGFTTSPGYQFQMNEGLKSIDAGAAARGMLASGQTQKAEMGYAQGLASQNFDNYYNRLLGLSTQGLQAAGTSANASMNAGANIADTQTSAGTALANIYGNMYKGVGNGINNSANQLMYAQGGGFGGGGGTGVSGLNPDLKFLG
jgi:hypothetical protein